MTGALSRRDAITAFFSLIGSACTGAKPAPSAPETQMIDLVTRTSVLACVPGAGLSWVFRARLREIQEAPELVGPLAAIFTEPHVRAFAASNGGLDPREIKEYVVAQYTDATLYAARTIVDPARVEASFKQRGEIEGRGVDLQSPSVVRLFGSVHDKRVQLATLGRDAVACEVGRFGPLRAFEAFAMRKLHRAKPAIETEPLATLLPQLEDAHAVALAPAPFDATALGGLGGLLAGATAAGVGARVDGRNLHIKVVLSGAWEDDAPAASKRLAAAIDGISQSSLGRLTGLDSPTRPVELAASSNAIAWSAAFSVSTITVGLQSAVDLQTIEIMK